jgi:hypothetical protein
MTRGQTLGALVAVYVAAVVAAVVGAEIYLHARGFGDRCWSGVPEHPGPPASWAVPHATFGWVATPASDINPQGFRDPRDFATVDLAAPTRRVLVVGDSFTWGAEERWEDTLTRRLERTLGAGWTVFNASAPGWGIDQMYLAYLAERDALRPAIVVLAYIDDDVARVVEPFRYNENLAKPVFRLDGDGVALIEHPPSVDERGLARSVLFRCAGREVQRATTGVEITRRLLARLVAETAARDERLLVVRIADEAALAPWWRAPWHRARRFDDVIPATAWLDTTDAFAAAHRAGESLYRPLGHLTGAGTQMLAEIIAPRLRLLAPGD